MPRVYVSDVIDATRDDVWAVLRDFSAMDEWHPLIAEMHMEEGQPADQVGAVRAFTLTDGGRLRERLLSLSDYDYHFRYDILESPLPWEGYVAECRLLPITVGNRTFIEWSTEFVCAQDKEPELVQLVSQEVFLAAFEALKLKLEKH